MDGFHPPHLNGSYTVAVDVHNDFISMQQNRMGASIKMAVESSKARTALYRAHNSHPFSGVLIRDAGNQFIRQHFAIACAAKKKKKKFWVGFTPFCFVEWLHKKYNRLDADTFFIVDLKLYPEKHADEPAPQNIWSCLN